MYSLKAIKAICSEHDSITDVTEVTLIHQEPAIHQTASRLHSALLSHTLQSLQPSFRVSKQALLPPLQFLIHLINQSQTGKNTEERFTSHSQSASELE